MNGTEHPPTERIVYVCACGNQDCQEEALQERCRFYRSWMLCNVEECAAMETAEWEG